jgi:SAM-dependent methyltransferase
MTQKEMTPRARRLFKRVKYQLGYDKTDEQPHAELLQWFERKTYALLKPHKKQTKGVILVPRSCFKTTDVTIGGTIDLLAENPNLSILLLTHTHDFTMQILSEIKDQFVRNEKLREEIGDVRTGSTKWAEDAITLATRTVTKKEPSIDTAALDRPKTGGHYDVIIIDDIHTLDNITPKLLKKARKVVNECKNLLKPGGVFIVIGTRWHHQDIYGWIRELDADRTKRGKEPEWDVFRRGCYDGPEGLYFPTGLGFDHLEDLRASLTDKEFAAQYLNEPIEESTSVFPATSIQWFDGDYLCLPGQAPYIRMRTHVQQP